MANDLIEDLSETHGSEGQVSSNLRAEINPVPPVRGRESGATDRVAPDSLTPETSSRLISEAGLGAFRSGVAKSLAAEVNAAARNTAGIGDAGSAMTLVHGGETINGRRVIGRDGRQSVVTGVGKFEMDSTSGLWVPSTPGGESAGSKPSRRAQSENSGELPAVSPAGSIAQFGLRQTTADKDSVNSSNAATDQSSSTQNIADALSGIVRRPQGSHSGKNDNLEVKLNSAHPTDSESGSPSSQSNLLAQSIPGQQKTESERKEKPSASSYSANPSDSESGSPSSQSNLLAQSIPGQQRSESERKEKPSACSYSANPSDSQSGLPSPLSNLLPQSIAAQQSPTNEPKERKIAGAASGLVESATAFRPLSETPSQPFNVPSKEEKEKKPSGGSAPSESPTGLLGGLLSQSISQAARPEGEMRDLDKKKPPSSPLGEARNDPPSPVIQSVGNVIRNIEPPKKTEPEVHGGTGQEQTPPQLARQHTPSELAEDKIRNNNLYNLGQGSGPAYSNPHQVDNRDKEKEQFLSSGQIPPAQARTPEQLTALAQLANQVPAGGGSPRPEEPRIGEARRVVENLNQLQEGNPPPQVQQQFNNQPRPEGGIAPVESFENRVGRRLAEVVENPAPTLLDPRQLLHPVEIYSNPPVRPERPIDLPTSIGPRPIEQTGPVNPLERPPALQDLRTPDVPTVSRLPESQLSQRPAQDPTPPVRSSEPPLPLRSAPDLPSVLRANPEQIQTARPADPVPVSRAPELTVSPQSPRQAEQLYAPSNRSERIMDQLPPPLSSDRKTDSTNQPSLQERRAELVAPPPLSTTDKRQESAGAREFAASGTRLRDFLRDEAMPDLQRSIKEIGKEPLILTFSGQKMELLKGLEQNLILPSGKLEAIKEGLNLASLQRSDGVARNIDSGISAKGEVVKPTEGTGPAGNQRVDTGKVSDLTLGSKSDATMAGEGKGITGNASGNGAKTSDGLQGTHNTHTTISGQREGESEPSRRPEATGKVDNGADVESDADEDGAGKKMDEKSVSITDVPIISGFAIGTESDRTDDSKSAKSDDEDRSGKDSDRRLKYIVKKGDTLESISEKMLRDRKLAPLVYDINKKIIPTKLQKGRKALDLRPKLIIFLPTPKEIKDYRAIPLNGVLSKFEYAGEVKSPEQELQNLFGDWSGKKPSVVIMSAQDGPDNNSSRAEVAGTTAADAAQELTESIDGINQLTADPKESTNLSDELPVTVRQSVEHEAETAVDIAREFYAVRLGDTLKSVAMSHPSLKDVSLWRLLAQVNNLSTVIDRHGVPVAKLSRGLKVGIPTDEEIRCFRYKLSVQPVIPYSVSPQLSNTSRQDTSGSSLKDLSSASVERSTNFPRRHESASTETIVVSLAEHCRYVKSSVGQACTDFRLEVEYGTRWLPIVSYQIFDDKAIRHEIAPDGNRKTLNIDLPLKAVHELAENDIASNWTQYCAAYLQRIGA